MVMKKILSSFLALTMTSGLYIPTVSAEEENDVEYKYYVSLSGDDANTGTTPDTAFRSIEKAQEAVRAVNDSMSGDIYIYIMGGEYFLDAPINIGAEDSGNDGCNIIYTAYNDEEVLISGGVEITNGWEIYDEAKGIYKKTGIDWDFRQLYTNGDRAIRARTPNVTNEITGGPYTRITDDNGSRYPMKLGVNRDGLYANNGVSEIIWVSSWSQFRARIDNYDWLGTGQVTFKAPDNTFAWNHHTQGNTPYFLENSLGYLDAEGEWFLDKETDTLYYKPRTGEVMNETRIIAPKLETLVNIEGNSVDDKVKNITISNIKFNHTNWLAPDSYGYCSVQGGFRYQTVGGKDNGQIRGTARYEAPKSMVQLRYTSNVTLDHNDFSFSGSWGVMGYEGTDHTMISWNRFYKNAGGGVTMGMAGNEWDDMDENEKIRTYTDMDGQSVYDSIMHNTIDTVACDYKDMVGIGAMLPQHMTIAHNEIANLPYTGINVGWNWQDTDHGMTGNMVYQNYIHDVCMLLQDGGGIYTLGRMDGDSNFYYNYVKNIAMSEWAPHDNLMGIYFDNGSCYKKAQSNVFDNTVYSYQASNPPNHDNIFEGNYYNCPKGTSSINESASILNIPYTSDNVPDEVKKIIAHAGPGTEDLPLPKTKYNLAFNKSVTASESDDEFPAYLATDGDRTTRWAQKPIASQPDTSKEPTWLMVDLEKESSISEIVVSFQYGNRCKYKIEYSADGNTWETYVDKLDENASPDSTIYATKENVSARYVKLTMNSEGWGSSVYEICVYTNDASEPDSNITPSSAIYDRNPMLKQEITVKTLLNGSTLQNIKQDDYTLVSGKDYIKHWDIITLTTDYLDTLSGDEAVFTFDFDEGNDREMTIKLSDSSGAENVALYKPITSSSSSKSPSYMVDGDKTTRWAQIEGTPNVPSTINLDLEAVYDISAISIMFELNSGYNYKIEYSTDNTTWYTYADKMSSVTTEQTITERGEVQARYIRLVANHSQWGASIYELSVFGKEVKDIKAEIVSAKKNGESISVQTKITNNTGADIEADVYTVLYDGDGRLIGVDAPSDGKISIGENLYTVNAVSENVNNIKCKIFIWKVGRNEPLYDVLLSEIPSF